MSPATDRIFTVPNLLSMLRLALLPLFVLLDARGSMWGPVSAAAVVFALSAATDMLDGWIARRFDQTSDLGKLLDPVADKLTAFVTALCLCARFGYMPLLAVILFAKESFMAVMGAILLRRGQKLDGAKWFGKASAAFFYVMLTALLFFPQMPCALADALQLTSAVLFLLALLLYIPVFAAMFRRARS